MARARLRNDARSNERPRQFFIELKAEIAAREKEYRDKFANPFIASQKGYIDDVIMPHNSRRRLCRALAMLRNKKIENPWRKHGNIPL